MTTTLTLAPTLDLNASVALKASLTEHRGEDLPLAARVVPRLGGLCLQLLLAARRAWAEDGHGFAIAPRSEAFTAAIELYGATSRFADDHSEGTPQ